MHLLVPFASDRSEACQHVLRDLALPNLERLLAPAQRRRPRRRRRRSRFSPPHERALAAAWGWHGGDGLLPFAAHAAAGDGIAIGDAGLGAAHAGALAARPRRRRRCSTPALLALDEAESRALFASAGELLASEGFAVAWGATSAGTRRATTCRRWRRRRSTASSAATSTPGSRAARRGAAARRPRSPRWCGACRAKRSCSSTTHPVNDAREERGALAVNSFWLSGCGRRAADAAPRRRRRSPRRLRAPLLAGDWAAWAEAWRALDAGADRAAARACAQRRGDDAHPLRRTQRGALRRCGRARSGSACAAPRRAGRTTCWPACEQRADDADPPRRPRRAAAHRLGARAGRAASAARAPVRRARREGRRRARRRARAPAAAGRPARRRRRRRACSPTRSAPAAGSASSPTTTATARPPAPSPCAASRLLGADPATLCLRRARPARARLRPDAADRRSRARARRPTC